MGTTEIKDFITDLEEKCKDGDYIFRGTNEIYSGEKDGINSSLYRETKKNFNEKYLLKYLPISIEKETVERARRRLSDSRSNIEILTDIQHFGGKTTLIDFSRNLYIALFFACNGKGKEKGEVILLRTNGISKHLDINYEKREAIAIIDPPLTKSSRIRVTAQHSVFVRSPYGYIDQERCKFTTVEFNRKKGILEYLRKFHHISDETIYKDLIGFIDNEEKHSKARSLFHKAVYLEKEEKQYREGIEYIEYYNQAIELKPDFPEAYNNRGNAKYDSREDDKGAIKDYDQAIKLKPDFPEAYYNRGLAKYTLGKPQEAIEDYNQAIKLKPDYAKAYNSRGLAKYTLGKPQEAIEDYDKVIELKPDFPEAYNRRGLAKYTLGKPQEAIEDFSQAIKLKPDFPEAYNNRGLAKQVLGNHRGAIEDYDQAIKLKPDFPEAYNNRGVTKCASTSRDYPGAIEDYNQAIKLKPDYAEAYNNRGLAKQVSGKPQEAIEDYNQAIKLKPDYAEAYNNRGLAKQVSGKPQEAIEDYNQAIKLKPDFPEAYYNRGNAKCVLGGDQGAIEDFKRAKLDPQYEKMAANMIKKCEEEIRKRDKK